MASQSNQSTKYMAYDRSKVDLAIRAVKSGTKVAVAARYFKIPRKTLDDRIKGRVASNPKPGRKFVLTKDCEKKMVDYLDYISRRGITLTRVKLRPLIREIARNYEMEEFCSDGPSDQWFRNFCSRHPKLKVQKRPCKMPDSLDDAMTVELVNHWFGGLERLISRLTLPPSRIYTCGEMTLGDGNTYYIQLSPSDCVSCMTTVSGDGRSLPCMVVYKGSYPHSNFTENIPGNWVFGISDTGYVNYHLFQRWFEEIFLKSCSAERPVLLILSDTCPHLNFNVVQRAREENIELLFYNSKFGTLQPLEAGVFSKINKHLIQKASSLRLFVQGNIISRTKLPALWKSALDDVSSVEVVKDAFLRCGIIPLSKSTLLKYIRKYLSPAALTMSFSVLETERNSQAGLISESEHEEEQKEEEKEEEEEEEGEEKEEKSCTCGIKVELKHIPEQFQVQSYNSEDLSAEMQPETMMLEPSSSLPVAAETVVVSDDTQYCPYCQEVWNSPDVWHHEIDSEGQIICRKAKPGTVVEQKPLILPQCVCDDDRLDGKPPPQPHTKSRLKTKPPRRKRGKKRKLANYSLVQNRRPIQDKDGIVEEYDSYDDEDSFDDDEVEEEEEEDKPEDEDEEVCNKCFRNWPEGQKTRVKLSWISCSRCCRWFHRKCVGGRKTKHFLCHFCCKRR